MIELSVVLLTTACGLAFYLILKDCIRDYRAVAKEDKQYKLALSYIKRHHKYDGVIPTPANVWLYGGIRKSIAIKAYEDYIRGEL